MEFLIVFSLYMMGSFISSFFFTAAQYKSNLKLPLDWSPDIYSDEVNLEKEAKRREIAAKNAKKTGGWLALFWIIVIPVEIIMQVISWANNSVEAVSISSQDQEFKNKVAAIKAKKILEEYEQQQEDEFDKALKEE